MSRSLFVRLLESLFRRWWLCLLPLLLLTIVGVTTVQGKAKQYRADAVMYVSNDTLLSRLSPAPGQGSFSWLTPAQIVSQDLSSALQTEEFIEQVAHTAGLDDNLVSGQTNTLEIRRSLAAWAEGSNLVRVRAVNIDPNTSYTLVSATLASFFDWGLSRSAAESSSAEKFFEDQSVTYRAELTKAQKDLTDYVASKKEPAPGVERPLTETIEITRLNDAVTAAQNRLRDAQNKGEAARLSTVQAREELTQRMRIVDEPKVPTSSDRSLKSSIFSLGAFLTLGLLLSFAAVVVGAVTDRSIRMVDIRESIDMPVIAAIPVART